MDDVRLALYADADFAGCVESLCSTSGGHFYKGPIPGFRCQAVQKDRVV